VTDEWEALDPAEVVFVVAGDGVDGECTDTFGLDRRLHGAAPALLPVRGVTEPSSG
jgi:hypothetical protein